MLFVWIFILIGLFIIGAVYFQFTPALVEILATLQTQGAPESVVMWILRAYHISMIMLAVGMILYGIVKATQTEPDSYQV